MTKKLSMSWADQILADSNLPSDEFTWTTGDNYGLDGFQYDVSYNEGVEQAARLPEAHGLSDLPQGLVADEIQDDFSYFEDANTQVDEDGFNLETMLSEGDCYASDFDKQASVVDLSWLNPVQKQDPERLPKKPESVEELEGKWKGASAFKLIPNVDKVVSDYEAWLKKPVTASRAKTAEVFRDAILRAVRRSHYGHDLKDIKAELVATLGHDAVRAKQAMVLIEAEHGLAGTVFVRASAFPGLKNGKWADKLKKAARTARYVITDDQTVADKIGMQMVAQVPWQAALLYYAPKLRAAGYKLASDGSPQAILKAAFLSGPAAAAVPEGHKPVDVRPADRVTPEQAVKAFQSATPTPRQVVESPEARQAEQKRQKVLVQIAKWVKAGKLSQEDALRLRAARVDAYELQRITNALVAAAGEQHVYDGAGAKLSKNAQQARQAVWKDLAQVQAAVDSTIRRRFDAYLSKVVKAGLLTSQESQRLSSLDRPVVELERLIAAAVQTAQQHRKAFLPVPDIREYMGRKFTAFRAPIREKFSEEGKRVVQQRVAEIEASQGPQHFPDNRVKMKPSAPAPVYAGQKFTAVEQVAVKQPKILTREFDALERWARQQMTEGVAGKDFDSLLAARWSQPLLKAASKMLRKLRAEYEGVAGHLYVDAAAYASQYGTKGCDQGSLKHRANQVKYVKAMDRCSGCSFARTLPNGSVKCSNYNKPLINDLPIENIKAYQAENIRLANASDAENTAAVFDPTEYNLTSPLAEDLTLDSTPSVETLGEILFGGMELG